MSGSFSNAVSSNGVGVVPDSLLNAFVQTDQTATQLRNFIGQSGMAVMLQGIAAPGDGGAGLFYWNNGNYTDNNSTVIVPFGAVGQGAWLLSPLITASGGPFLPLTGGTVSGSVTVGILTGTPPPAPSLTVSQKLYVGAATARNSSNQTWVSTDNSALDYFDVLNQIQSLSQPGFNGVAAMFGVRSSDTNVSTSLSFGGIANISYALNDAGATSPLKEVWSHYIVASRYPGSGSALGIEFECSNWGDAQVVNSYSSSHNGLTVSLWCGSGGDSNGAGASPNPLSAHMVMFNGHATPVGAEKGIVFQNSAVRRDATTTAGSAIQMAKGHQLEWIYDGSGIVGSFVRGVAAAASASILFNGSGFNIVDTTTETSQFNVAAGGEVTIGNASTNQILMQGGSGTSGTAFLTPGGTGGLQFKFPSIILGASTANNLVVTPGTSSGAVIVLQPSGTAGVQIKGSSVELGNSSGNSLTFTPGASSSTVYAIQQTGTGGTTIPIPLFLGNSGNPSVTAGSGAPSGGGSPTGSIYIQTDGSVGARIWVYQGSTTWLAIAGV